MDKLAKFFNGLITEPKYNKISNFLFNKKLEEIILEDDTNSATDIEEGGEEDNLKIERSIDFPSCEEPVTP